MKKEGKNFRLPGHGGLLVAGNKYWHASTGKGGNAIDFLVEVEKMSFLEAVEELLGGEFSTEKKEPETARTATDSLPPKANKNNRVIAYLTRTRKIPVSLVLECIEKKILYQDDKGNAVFPCWPAGGIIEGTLSQVRFKKRIGSGIWILPGTGTNVAVVESPIDALSLKTIQPKVGTIAALGGTHSERALLALLSDLKPKKVYLALDNDKAGQEANLRLFKKISFQTEILKPEKKDWNEDLIGGFTP
ncbi:toprim domain-containing protein [Peptococcaceae bacterium]|nr:toprim domain-containing protein [Peptococcaceae bacterium]